MSQYKIVVFGSLNMDLVATTTRLPVAGETLTGENFTMNPGGKGANQAIAVSRLGIPSSLVGRVGNDSFGQQLSQGLAQDQVDTTGIAIDQTTHTGVALIGVDQAGENQIIVIPEANGNLDETDIERLRPYLQGANLLLMQLEIPLNLVASAAEVAQNMGVQVILDPAPAPTFPPLLFIAI